ncbi:MAG: exopolyphosphatase [Bacteroidota bacterium]
MYPYAVIDLGTNTFHLLIAETDGKGFRVLYKERIFVKLGENGVETIGRLSFERGVLAMKHYSEVMQQFRVSKVKAIGTAALRTASNGQEFLNRVKAEADIEIETISGDLEAQLIHKGVSLAVPIEEHQKVLMMDIGGGSIEFIIANMHQVLWAQSFPIGVAVLFNKFHHSDPIAPQEITELSAFLHETLRPLDQALQQFPVNRLIGASGTFDVLEDNLEKIKEDTNHSIIQLSEFTPFLEKVLQSTQAQRYQIPQIPRERADLIVVALLLIQVTLKKLDIDELSVSHFAMKEGILREMVLDEQS